jgi:hypothetical protein
MPEQKPKKVLTEAQRLAFIKGREKRMQNIMLKKAEKEESREIEESKTETETEPETTTESEPEPTKPLTPIPPLKLKREKRVRTPLPAAAATLDQPEIDFDALADKIAEKIKIQEPKPKRRYAKKEKVESEIVRPKTPSPARVQYAWC